MKLTEIKTRLAQLKIIAASNESERRRAVAAINNCYVSYTKVILSFVCIKCSKKSDYNTFFTDNGYPVKANVCQELVSSCSALFAYTSQLSMISGIMTQIRAALGGDTNFARSNTPSMDEVNILRACASDVDACKQNSEILQSVCNQFTVSAANDKILTNPITIKVANLVA